MSEVRVPSRSPGTGSPRQSLGDRVAVVISRGGRVYEDDRGPYGEVGGADQYRSDRGLWRIGKQVREEARYAIIAVKGTVVRVYELDPYGWRQVMPGKWEFTAVGDRELTETEIAAACAAGNLPLRPRDDCPTRAGGAYRPHRF